MMKRLVEWYRLTGMTLLSVMLLFFLLNVVAAIGISARNFIRANVLSAVSPVYEKYGEAIFNAYPGMGKEDVSALLDETWARSFEYESVSQFREKPHRGRFITVDEAGFRHGANQGPWPPSEEFYNVFVFGGSTTFGYGLPDGATLPSFLQMKLGRMGGKVVRVYNFGRGHYFSSHETLLFLRLLWKGHVPDLAVFVDGVNDFYHHGVDDLLWTDLYASVEGEHEAKSLAKPLKRFVRSLPLTRVLDWLARHGSTSGRGEGGSEISDADEQAARVVDRYLSNVVFCQDIARTEAVRTVFVVQPMPLYKYNLDEHPFAGFGFDDHVLARTGYPLLERRLFAPERGDLPVIWAADMQENMDGILYVDQIHYSPAMAEALAALIADGITRQSAASRARRTDRARPREDG